MNDPFNAGAEPFQAVLAGGGEMGALMRARDWSITLLGSPDRWPQSLRTAISICLNSRFPILLWWGPELIMLYNDAYSSILGAKHPRALGQPGQECWPEIWHIIGPMLEGVLRRGEATWSDDQLLVLERNDYPEECYFTFSYSPIRGETERVGGVFTAVTETTGRVLGERRMRTLRDLGANAGNAKSAEEACAIAAETLAGNDADVPFACIYLLDAEGTEAHLVATTGLAPGEPAAPSRVDLATPAAAWPLAHVARTGKSSVVEDIIATFGPLPGGRWPDSPHTALVIPVTRPGQEQPYGLLVAALSPRRTLDDSYRGFFDLVAGQIASAVANARAHEEERRRADALAELDRAKTTFFSNVSHEFRTPLTLLSAPVQELLTQEIDSLSPSQRERLEIANRNALRLLKLVNTLLDFSRIETQRIEASFEPVDLATYTADLASSFRSAVEHAGLRLIVNCPPLPEAVYIDRQMWEKIVLNLLSNAFKFTLAGEIEVALAWHGDNVQLTVRDTGIGIPDKELPHIFERFHRVQGARGRTQEGTGIGLSLVQELVNYQHGRLEVESREGKGTTFTVTLLAGAGHLPADRIGAARTQASTALSATPFVEEALRWLPDELPANTALAPAAVLEMPPPHWAVDPVTGETGPGQTPARILVVDDNADMRDYLKRLLNGSWQVETAADGLVALASARERPPDLVLTDVMMPGLDGFELLRQLRNDPRTQPVPVILLSARAGEESRLEGLASGADDYLVKPFSARELLARVSAHLALARLRGELSRYQEENVTRLQELALASLAINSPRSLDALLTTITEQAGKIVNSHLALTMLVEDWRWEQARYSALLSDKYAAYRDYNEQPTGSGIYGLVCETNRPMRLTQAELETHSHWRGYGEAAGVHPPLRGWLAVPLIGRDGRNLGLIQLSDKIEGEFTEADEAVLVHLAQVASIAIENIHLYEEAQRASLARDEVLATVSHDLGNSLSAVLTTVNLFLAGAIPEVERAEYLQGMQEAVQMMYDLIDDLLDIARIEGGELVLDRQQCTAGDLITTACTFLRPLAEEKNLWLRYAIEEDVPPFTADRRRIVQVLQNLGGNAIKFTDEGGVSVSARYVRGAIHFSVSDTGDGIAAPTLPHLFDRFFQARKVAQQGAGLGLPIVKGIVEAHGGRVWVESSEGEGSTFFFTLPARVPAFCLTFC